MQTLYVILWGLTAMGTGQERYPNKLILMLQISMSLRAIKHDSILNINGISGGH